VRLTCLDFAYQWEHEETSKYPEIGTFIEKLKRTIREKPEKGLPDPIIFRGQNLPCWKQSVNISLFPRRHAIGYSFITAHYLRGTDEVVIAKFAYT